MARYPMLLLLACLTSSGLVAATSARDGAPDEAGPSANVQQFTEGGDPGAMALHVHHAVLGRAGRETGSQSADHFETVAVGSGANGEPNADIAASFSLIKKDWTSYAAKAGEADVITCNGRNGGPIKGADAGHSDMNCMSINIQNTKGSGYLAGIEAVVSDVDPRRDYAIDHDIGLQLGVDNARDGDYEGVVAISNNGLNTAAFHAQSSANGSHFALYQKDTAYCAGAANNLQDVFVQDASTGLMTWTPCLKPEGKVSVGADEAGHLVVRNDAGAPVLTVDQGGNVSSLGTPILPSYSYDALRSISASVKGRVAFCTDCRKPGEATGTGTGMQVFSDGRSSSSWYTTAGTLSAR